MPIAIEFRSTGRQWSNQWWGNWNLVVRPLWHSGTSKGTLWVTEVVLVAKEWETQVEILGQCEGKWGGPQVLAPGWAKGVGENQFPGWSGKLKERYVSLLLLLLWGFLLLFLALVFVVVVVLCLVRHLPCHHPFSACCQVILNAIDWIPQLLWATCVLSSLRCH